MANGSPAVTAVGARLQKDIDALTAQTTRLPGTRGNMEAATYVQNRFQQIGLSQVRADEYSVTTPITKSASIEIGGQSLGVYPVYPNQVVASTTPPGGISGPLVYVGQGRVADYNGQKIKGSIAVLDFNSGMNWITAIDLGARAIVFLEPEVSNRGEAERKFTLLPVEVPRFYATGATAAAIRAANGQESTVKSLVVWEKMPVKNVLGFLPGKKAPGKKANTLIVNAYYDSMSVVPDLAPGAEAAGNLAAFLELAARLKANPPNYNVLFVANGSHHLALAGTRNFIADHVIDKTGAATGAKKTEIESYRGFINLDLTSRTPTVGFFAKSWFYNQMGVGSENILLNQFGGLAKNLGRFAEEIAKKERRPVEEFFVDGVTGKDGRTWRSYLPSLVALDSEVATMAGLPGVSFASANDARLYQDTPFDTKDRLDMPNLTAQVGTVETLLRKSLNDIAYSDSKNQSVFPTKDTLTNNFGFFTGRGIYRDVEQATSFLPDTPMPDSQIGDEGKQSVGVVVSTRDLNPLEQKSYAGVRGLMIERAGYSQATPTQKRVAQFTFIGPRVGDPKGGGTPDYEFEAFTLDRNGHMIFAPDRGAERQRFSPIFKAATATLNYSDAKLNQISPDSSLIVFKSRATTLFDTLDQRYFTVLTEMTVLDAKTDANPVEFGYLRPAPPPGVASIEPIAVVFGKYNDRDEELTTIGVEPEQDVSKGERFKLIMAAGLLGKRLVLLNTDPTNPLVNGKNDTRGFEGRGFAIRNTEAANRILRVSYQSALDLWVVDQQRIRLLKGFGINNERVDALHGSAGCKVATDLEKFTSGFECPKASVAAPNGGSLIAAQTALDAQQFDVFYREARRAFGLESRAYPDVEATSQDVLKGIIFYLALLLPFAYFVERMIFGFPDVRKQIMGTSLVFLAVFVAIRFVHPAFELALTPFIILLAFVILALTVIVTAFLQGKFEQEIKRMKQGVHYADMGRLSALGAAVGLGIANMRRRPTRTALTCVTLILLTFTVLSFTSVTANIANFARPYGDNKNPPAYQGFLLRQPDWGAMPEVAVASLSNEITARELGQPALRSWYLSRDQGEPLYLRVNNAQQLDKFYYAPALLGMTPEETAIGSPVTKTVLPGGRWFETGDEDVALVPRDVLLSDAQRAAENPNAQTAVQPGASVGSPLGLTLENAVGSTIQVAGKDLEIIGVFDDRQWYGRNSVDNLRDLDNEEFSPVNYGSDQNKSNATSNSQSAQQGGETQVQRYEHMRANALLVLPYQTALDMGATTRSMAVGISDPVAAQTELDDLMSRAALGIFGATPEIVNGQPTGPLVSKLYSSVEATSYDGFAALAIPVLIAALIIANTMLGSVFERTKEIGIYSSIGLAPVHIGALFIAEAMVYAVLGSISGYLIAQVVAKIITATNALPGITLNYSSSSAVIATLIVMLTVMLSTVYPAIMASKISSPEGGKNDLGEPVGDLWRLQFPFTVSGAQSLGMAQFLADFFESHTDTSVGKFFTDKVFFSGLPLIDAVALLNEGVPHPDEIAAMQADIEANGSPNANSRAEKKAAKAQAKTEAAAAKALAEGKPPIIVKEPTGGWLELDEIIADPDTQVYRLALRTWLAPFDMGVSQDTDIILLPAKEPGLYELQLRLARRSGEISAWKRVNKEFMTELRKQLLVWRTVKPEQQQEYILRGRAHVRDQMTVAVPVEDTEAVVV